MQILSLLTEYAASHMILLLAIVCSAVGFKMIVNARKHQEVRVIQLKHTLHMRRVLEADKKADLIKASAKFWEKDNKNTEEALDIIVYTDQVTDTWGEENTQQAMEMAKEHHELYHSPSGSLRCHVCMETIISKYNVLYQMVIHLFVGVTHTVSMLGNIFRKVGGGSDNEPGHIFG